MSSYLKHFDDVKGFAAFPEETDYRTVFAQSALMLTDYSSTVFDFSYLRKPVLYAQFDKEEFFSGLHTYTPSYFDYEKDGFGDVLFDYESTVNALIDYVRSDCALKDKYRERIDNFFAYNDKNNCHILETKTLISIPELTPHQETDIDMNFEGDTYVTSFFPIFKIPFFFL